MTNAALQLSAAPAPAPVLFTPGEVRVFRARERDPETGRPITVSTWADRYRTVTEGEQKGPWSTAFAAYTREPMDAWNLPHVREIILCWAPQSSKTQVALNCLGYSMDQAPGPVMWIVPNEKKAADAANKKILPMIRTSKRLADLLSPRFRDTTDRFIRLTNGMEIMIPWASSAAELAAESIRYLFFDETDKYKEFAGKEADPIALGEQRVIAFPYTHKIVKLSTPALDADPIWTAMTEQAVEIRDYKVPCPACGHMQVMAFENITWPSDIKDWRTILYKKRAFYSCERCGMKWSDRMKNAAVRWGRWVPRVPAPDGRPASIAYHLPRWYSPFCSFSDSAAAYLRGLEEPSRDMVFITQHKAEGYSERIDEQKKESEVLKQHCCSAPDSRGQLQPALPPLTVPARAVALTCGYDSHKDYFKFTTWAWDRDLNHWLIEYGILSTLDDVEQHCFGSRYAVEGAPAGETMSIWRAAIDIGGGKGKDGEMTQTEEIKRWLHKMKRRNIIFAVKGASHKQIKRIQFSLIGSGPKTRRRTALNAGKLELRTLDTDRLKLDVHWRMERTPGQPQAMYFHARTGEDFALELLAEEFHRDRKGNTYWKKVRTANHYLDCTVYAHACADPEWLPSLIMLARRLKDLKTIRAGTDPSSQQPAGETLPGHEDLVADAPAAQLWQPPGFIKKYSSENPSPAAAKKGQRQSGFVKGWR